MRWMRTASNVSTGSTVEQKEDLPDICEAPELESPLASSLFSIRRMTASKGCCRAAQVQSL